MQACDDGERERQRDRVADDVVEADGMRDRQDQRRDGRLTDQPRPSEASVMPSCVTESDASRWSVSCLAYLAWRLPS